MNNKGQSILSEYVMIFFVVIAAAVAMTTFLQRAFEARVHDARNFAITSVMSNSVCDANCVQAAGGNITYEYEPYYSQTLSDVQQNQQDSTGLTPGSAEETGTKSFKFSNEASKTISTSTQLSPECAGPKPPAYCGS